MKLIVILKKTCKRHLLYFMPLLVLRDVHKFDTRKGQGGEGEGGFFIKEQWEKSLLSVGPENSHGYLLRCCK